MDPHILKNDLTLWHAQKIKIIGIAGKRRTGKDAFLACLEAEYSGITYYRIAEAPVEIAKILRLPPDREILDTLFGVNALLRPIIGESAYKRRVAKLIEEERPACALVAALRTEEEYEEFIVKRGGILIGLRASLEVRFKRTQSAAGSQNEKSDEATIPLDRFKGDPEKGTGEYHLIQREIDSVVDRSHFVIQNDFDTLPPFHEAIRDVLSALGIKKK